MWNTKKSANLGPNGRQEAGGCTPRNISQDTSARVRCADIFGARVGIVYRLYDRLRRGVTRVKRKSTYLATGDLAEHAPDQQKLNFIAVTLHPGKKVNKLDEIEWTTGLLRRDASDKRWRWLLNWYKSSITLLMALWKNDKLDHLYGESSVTRLRTPYESLSLESDTWWSLLNILISLQF